MRKIRKRRRRNMRRRKSRNMRRRKRRKRRRRKRRRRKRRKRRRRKMRKRRRRKATVSAVRKDIFRSCRLLLTFLIRSISHSIIYSLVHLVWPNTEELISRPFMGLSKIRLLLQDHMSPKNVR